jgi:hypothetical protein
MGNRGIFLHLFFTALKTRRGDTKRASSGNKGQVQQFSESQEPEEGPMRTCPACGKVALMITERLRDEDIRAVYLQIFGPRGPP